MRYRFTLDNATLGPFVLPKNPVGWKDMSILVKRSPKYHGIFFNETVNLEFICGSGKEYLDDALNLGIDEVVTLLIEGECASGDGYEEEYTGRVSLKTWNTINGKSTADIIEDTIADTILNRMDTPIDLTKTETLDGTSISPFTYGPYEMDLHGKAIVYLSELSTDEDIQESEDVTQSQLVAGLGTPMILPVTLDELDFTQSYSTFIFSGSFPTAHPDPIHIATFDGLHVIRYDLSGTFSVLWVNGGSGFTCNMRMEYKIDNTRFVIHDYGIISGGSDLTRTVNFSEVGILNLNLNVGQEISVYICIFNFTVSVGSTGTNTITQRLFPGSFIKISTETVTDDTVAKVYGVFETGAGIFRSLANQVDVFRSEYYGRKNSEPHAYPSNGCGSFRAITNGALIRNFPITDRPLRITGNEYFDSLNAIDNLGLGIERISGLDYVVIEPKSHFYSNTRLFQLSNVPDIKISVAPEYYYNRFECGYETWQIKQKGGLDEVNSKRQYDLGLKTIDNPLVQISTLIAGGYPIEIARRKQYPDSFTEDFDTDNNNFIICLNRSVDGNGNPNNLTTAEKDENFISVTDVLSPETSYNLDISPGRNTLRWSPVLNVGLLKYPGRNMKFTYGEGNFKMTSQMNSSSCPGRWNNQPLSEGQDIQWDDANNTDNNPLWEPLIATFKNPLTRNQFNILKANPYGYIEVSERSTTYTKWFVLEAKRNPVGGMTEFKLLKKWE